MAQSLAVDLDLVHLIAIASEDALPPDRMRAVLERELAKLAVAMREHFVTEETVSRRTVHHEALVEEHLRLSERLREVCEAIHRVPPSATRSALIELLDLLGEHERGEIDAT